MISEEIHGIFYMQLSSENSDEAVFQKYKMASFDVT